MTRTMTRDEALALYRWTMTNRRAHEAYLTDPFSASKADTLRDARLRLQARAISRDEYQAIREEVRGW